MNQIPKTIEAAKATLTSIDGLVNAHQWERAALVWAFTTDEDKGGRPSSARCSVTISVVTRFSITGFAQLGIKGLQSTNTVMAYRTAWKAAIEAGSPDLKPGDAYAEPAIEWPGRQDKDGKRRYTEQTPSKFADAIDRGDVAVEEFAQDLSDEAAAAIVGRLAEDRPDILVNVAIASPFVKQAVQDPHGFSGRSILPAPGGDVTQTTEFEVKQALTYLDNAGRRIEKAIADLIAEEKYPSPKVLARIDNVRGVLELLVVLNGGVKA